MMGAPDAVHYRVAIRWGQLPFDRSNEVPRDWSGVLATNRGAIIARRAIAFEPATDRLLPRPDAQHLPFTSLTLPANVTLLLSGLELYSTVITYFQGNVSATNPVVVPIP